MMKKSKKIIFFGNERLATGVATEAPTLKALIDHGYNVQAVITNNETAVSRRNRPLEVAEVAKKHGVPVHNFPSLKEHAEEIKAMQPDAGVLVAYGRIVPESIIDLFPAGIINIHPSLLPKHRGPTPIESTILNDEKQTGVSLMKLVKAMDAGPVYTQETISVLDKVSKQELADELLKIGSKMLVQHLPAIIDGSLEPKPQNNAEATYDSLLSKEQGQLDWTKTAEQLEREIRAFQGWPKSTARLNDLEFIVTEADVVNTSGKPSDYSVTKKELLVHCGQASLSIKRLQPVNKKEMPVEAFLAGYSL